MAYFTAQAQYGDWSGEAEADDADLQGIRGYVQDKRIINKEDQVVGVTFYSATDDFISISVLVVRDGNEGDFEEALRDRTRKLPVESVDVELTLPEFFKLFKRFSVTLAPRGIDIAGREYDEE
ncbi:hypothetical protein [Cupriavidus taiwanensis]|uniref:hypothetical protein n=1 Tax=Cupriavidus taiwanensis TaxID=164546 RepID=UPI00046E89B6|nr:hypothetical protein [Cupriavidus taiwanensis]SOZ12090.1 conserved protein of unknown function [Cupriavidus taiwanensis]